MTTLEDISWVNEESTSVLTINYYRHMVLRWSILTQDTSVTFILKMLRNNCLGPKHTSESEKMNQIFTVPLQEAVPLKKYFFH
jgi:hypothetical protein